MLAVPVARRRLPAGPDYGACCAVVRSTSCARNSSLGLSGGLQAPNSGALQDEGAELFMSQHNKRKTIPPASARTL